MPTLTNLFQKVKGKLISLLLWSERYTKTDMLYLARSGAWLVLRRAVLMGSAFTLALAFANLVSKETYGTYKYILSTISILSTLTLSGMGTAIIQAVARGFDKTLIDGYRLKFKWDIIASFISLGLGIYYFVNGNTAFAIVYWFFAALFPFWDAASHYDDYLQGKTDFKTSARFDMLQQFALAVALIAAIFVYPKQSAVFVILWLAIQTLFATWYYRKIKNLIPANATSDPQAITYAKHLSVFSLITVVSDRLDNILIFQLLGPAQLAIYSFAIAIPEQIKGVLSNLSIIASPKFAKRSLSEIKASLKKKFFLLFLIGCAVVGSYIVAAPFIFHAFFPKYSDSIFYSQLFVISMLNMTFTISGTALTAQRRIKEQYIFNIAIPFIKVVLMTALILWSGLVGLIIARIITRFADGILSAILLYAAKEEQPAAGNNTQSQ